MKRSDTDPELRHLIETAAAGRKVSVVCSLRLDPRRSADPEETTQQVKALMGRVEGQTGEQPADSTVFGNLGSLALSASVAFVDRLIAQPEIATATVNAQSTSI
jgi:hypothetical protein